MQFPKPAFGKRLLPVTPLSVWPGKKKNLDTVLYSSLLFHPHPVLQQVRSDLLTRHLADPVAASKTQMEMAAQLSG